MTSLPCDHSFEVEPGEKELVLFPLPEQPLEVIDTEAVEELAEEEPEPEISLRVALGGLSRRLIHDSLQPIPEEAQAHNDALEAPVWPDIKFQFHPKAFGKDVTGLPNYHQLLNGAAWAVASKAPESVDMPLVTNAERNRNKRWATEMVTKLGADFLNGRTLIHGAQIPRSELLYPPALVEELTAVLESQNDPAIQVVQAVARKYPELPAETLEQLRTDVILCVKSNLIRRAYTLLIRERNTR